MTIEQAVLVVIGGSGAIVGITKLVAWAWYTSKRKHTLKLAKDLEQGRGD